MMQKRTFIFPVEEISCRNCQYNYPMPSEQTDKKYGEYCQEFCRRTPQTEEDCILVGHDCLQWFPRDISRSTAKGEHDDKRQPRWYEKFDV